MGEEGLVAFLRDFDPAAAFVALGRDRSFPIGIGPVVVVESASEVPCVPLEAMPFVERWRVAHVQDPSCIPGQSEAWS